MLIDIPVALGRVRAAITALGGDVAYCDVDPPATDSQVLDVERRLGYRLPEVLRRLFLEQSSQLKMHWIMEAGGRLPAMFGDGLSGHLDLSLDGMPVDLLNWSSWRDAFEDPAAHGWPPEVNVAMYRGFHPLITATNGDRIVIAEPDDAVNEVVYLNHEGADFDFVILADRFDDFMGSWVQLGCPGPEWWGLAPFLDPETLKLSLSTRRSRVWLKLLSAAAGG